MSEKSKKSSGCIPIGCLGLIILIFGIGAISSLTPHSAAPPPPAHTPAENLAIIDGADSNVQGYQSMLTRVSTEYVEDEAHAADIIANSRKMIVDKGEPESCMDMMGSLDRAYVPNTFKDDRRGHRYRKTPHERLSLTFAGNEIDRRTR